MSAATEDLSTYLRRMVEGDRLIISKGTERIAKYAQQHPASEVRPGVSASELVMGDCELCVGTYFSLAARLGRGTGDGQGFQECLSGVLRCCESADDLQRSGVWSPKDGNIERDNYAIALRAPHVIARGVLRADPPDWIGSVTSDEAQLELVRYVNYPGGALWGTGVDYLVIALAKGDLAIAQVVKDIWDQPRSHPKTRLLRWAQWAEAARASISAALERDWRRTSECLSAQVDRFEAMAKATSYDDAVPSWYWQGGLYYRQVAIDFVAMMVARTDASITIQSPYVPMHLLRAQ